MIFLDNPGAHWEFKTALDHGNVDEFAVGALLDDGSFVGIIVQNLDPLALIDVQTIQADGSYGRGHLTTPKMA